MIRLFSALLCLVVSASAFAQDYSYKVVYSGGSLASVRSGADATLYVDPTVVRIVVDHLNVVSIPSNTITQVAFGEEVPRTLGSLITLGKQKKHLGLYLVLLHPARRSRHPVHSKRVPGNPSRAPGSFRQASYEHL